MTTQRRLTFPYTRTSDLPRRTFVVDVEVVQPFDDEVLYFQVEVTSPDPVDAERRVSRYFVDDANVLTFQQTMLREVSTDWDRRLVVTVPSTFCVPQTLSL